MNKKLRKAVIAGNWKMNKTRPEAQALIEELKPLVAGAECEVVACVPFTNLETVLAAVKGSNIKVGAQNCHFEKSGAFTGEISADMLAEMGVEYVVIGHSERRQYFGETDETVNKRLTAALAAGLKVILCVGEMLADRENGITDELVALQTKIALKGVSAESLKNIIIAYEPVWAIGTGKTATADQAQDMHAHIRKVVEDKYGKEIARNCSILYGGSCKPDNAPEIFGKPDVDGGLIGGAALKADSFMGIIEAFG